METNGPANICMILDCMLEAGRISQQDHETLRTAAELTIKYMKAYSEDNTVLWSDVRDQVK